ncbi:MAG: hypothetical protein HY584_00690 [Candidatus Omnitrophica bacterium]|nr:hypothetical protein [Candidatus Omnitrophota bacterium]
MDEGTGSPPNNAADSSQSVVWTDSPTLCLPEQQSCSAALLRCVAKSPVPRTKSDDLVLCRHDYGNRVQHCILTMTGLEGSAATGI